MKLIAYTPLLYGRDYLGAAIRSVINSVDEYHVIYSPIGAHGHRTDVPCPETRDELYAIASAAAGPKLRWHEGVFAHEGQQRDYIHIVAPDADVILALDADEIWPDGLADMVTRPDAVARGFQRYRLPMVHFWRSFRRAVLHDPAFPERVIYPRNSGPVETFHAGGAIAHMGYAQRSEIVDYKLLTHGHRAEFRRDCDWFRDVFLANRQHDCHPVGSEYWNPEPVEPLDYLPEWVQAHPYYNLEVIP